MNQSFQNRGRLLPSAGPQGDGIGVVGQHFLPAPSFPAQEAAGGLPEATKILARHRGLLISMALVGLALGLVACFLQKPLYKARTALIIQNPNLDFLNTRQVNPVGEEPSTDNGLTDISTQLQILQSDELVDHVLAKLQSDGKLGPLQRQVTTDAPLLHRLIHGTHPSADDLDYAIHQQVDRNLSVKQLGPTRAVEIVYSSIDPDFAATFVNTVASEYVEMTNQEHLDRSKQTEEWLSGQLEEMRARLQESENALQTYARDSGLLFATPAGDTLGTSDISGSKLSQLQVELSAAQNDRVLAQSRYELARSAEPADLPDVLNDTQLRMIQERLMDLQRQRAELLSTFTDKNERVRKIDSQIPPLQAAYAEQRRSILHRIHDDYTMSMRREKLLKNSYDEQANVVVDKTNKGIQYNILKRQVDSNQQLYESMLEQVKRAGIAATIHGSNIQVFDPAKRARRPFSPNPVLYCGAGLAGGLLAGCLLIGYRNWGRQHLHAAPELENRTGLRVLGVIPNGWAELHNTTFGGRLINAGKAAVGPRRVTIASAEFEGEDSIELITWSKKPSFTAESFRSLLTSVLFADDHGSRPRTIVLSSANAGEGKTTLASNLAIAMAQVQQRVLLIDGDLRNPRVHKIFKLDNSFGLSTILSRPLLTPQSDLRIQPTFVPGLFVLPSGPPTAAAANLLHSANLAELLSSLRNQFDTIVIDTPPFLVATDARVVGRLSDAVILVVRAGQTPWEEAQAVVSQFEYDRTRVLGTVLNDSRRPTRDYAYYQAASY